MEQLTDLQARQILRERGVEMDMDSRSPVEIAETLLSTGSPAVRAEVEVALSEQPDIAQPDANTLY